MKILKKVGVAILVTDKIDVRIISITRDNEGHFIINGSIL